MTEIKKPILLIVEDEMPLRNALYDKFSREGFTVFSGRDGEIGFEIAQKQKPDLILLDMVMPKMDGMVMLKKLRLENGWGKNIRVILLTNLGADDEHKMKTISKDPNVYFLVKSNWSLGNLVEKVKEILSKD